jgi:hypothetical protein
VPPFAECGAPLTEAGSGESEDGIADPGQVPSESARRPATGHAHVTENAGAIPSIPTPEPGRRFRPAIILVAGVIVLVTIGVVVWWTQRPSDEEKVRALFDRQNQLYEDREWEGLYETFSPGLQARCSYSDLVAFQESLEDVSDVTFEDVRVTVRGDTAEMTYGVLDPDGQEIGQVTSSTPDLFVLVAGAWYDEDDQVTLWCGAPEQ